MARYFFNMHDGDVTSTRDEVGSVLPDIDSIRQEAVEATVEVIKGHLLATSDKASWIVQVTNEAGHTVMVLSLLASIQVLTVEPRTSS